PRGTPRGHSGRTESRRPQATAEVQQDVSPGRGRMSGCSKVSPGDRLQNCLRVPPVAFSGRYLSQGRSDSRPTVRRPTVESVANPRGAFSNCWVLTGRLSRRSIGNSGQGTAVGLWGATALALHPGVALVAAAAGAADVIENVAILHELRLPDPVPLVRWAGLTKWGLLGVVFIALVFLFRPDRVSGQWPSLLRA